MSSRTDKERIVALSTTSERGTAVVLSILIVALLSIFVAGSISRITNEALVMGNDYAQSKAFYAAHASLEKMSRNFGQLFQSKTQPTAGDKTAIEASTPNDSNGDGAITVSDVQPFPGFVFDQHITQIEAQATNTISDPASPYDGLYSLRDAWRVETTATVPGGSLSVGGVQVKLTRTFYNHLIPIFQFGVFYDGDLEISPSPVMYIGGRVHTNGNLFVGGRNGTYFQGRVTAVKEVVLDVQRSGVAPINTEKAVNFTTDGAGTYTQLASGSVTNGPDYPKNDPDEPDGDQVSNWASTYQDDYNGWLKYHANRLLLPLAVGTDVDNIEIIKRGLATDLSATAEARFFNKSCIRVSLDDSQSRLPGGSGGVRLDGASNGAGAAADGDGSRGYQPSAMTDGYQAVRVNGHRFYTGASYTTGGMPANRETWIKVERVTFNAADAKSPLNVTDITKDVLSLGVTQSGTFATDSAATNTKQVWVGDNSWSRDTSKGYVVKAAYVSGSSTADPSRAVLKLQRFKVDGPPIKVTSIGAAPASTTATATTLAQLNNSIAQIPATDPRDSTSKPLYEYVTNGIVAPTVDRYSCVTNLEAHVHSKEAIYPSESGTKTLYVNNQSTATGVTPFPIEMYDVREGLYFNDLGQSEWDSRYKFTSSSVPTTMDTVSNSNVPYAGVMSLIDVDMSNLKKLIAGTWDGTFPFNTNLGSDIRTNCNFQGRGFILYISDRRGDANNDGVYNNENVYVVNDKSSAVPSGTPSPTADLDPGEDMFGMGTGNLKPDGQLSVDYTWESSRYYTNPLNVSSVVPTDVAALFDHKQFRRGVRLINGSDLSSGTILDTDQGLTVATENGIYTLGNYNATGAAAPTTVPTPPASYTGNQVPAAVIGDALTLLSNEWNDGKSFRNPLYWRGDIASFSDTTGNSRAMETSATMTTTVRAAMMSGNTTATVYDSAKNNPGGTTPNGDGGAHNYPRFLESWGQGTARTNICGSLICLWHSRNNNGSFKFALHTYDAPQRNWTFDTSFQDATRLPPGTPYLQYVQMTGFRQALR